jgi:hypothetical protein
MELLVIPFSYGAVSARNAGGFRAIGRLTVGKKHFAIIIKKTKTCKLLQILI